MKYNPHTNPRFVWNIGAIHDQFPDLPEQSGHTTLWDRQECRAAVVLTGPYAQAFCLENAAQHGDPFSAVERWFNSLTNEDLASENLPITK